MKTRFCPSPTGHMHLGNVRTALFSILLARSQQGGAFLLRIEDTDQERSKSDFVDDLMLDLHWLGLDWDEGPNCEQGHGPYQQSQRQSIYDSYYETLIEKGQAYHCFCSEQTLAVNRKLQRAAGQAPRYPGTCRRLSDAQVAEKLAAEELATLRFHIPDEAEIVFEDLVIGPQRFTGDAMGDFVIRRTDGTASFMYCNAIDDALMGVTHALRGVDHLSNTPRQLLILKALGLTPPCYGHIALILGSDGAPLSKRNGSRSVRDLREEGYLPLAITNYLARLGHYYGDDELRGIQALADKFEIAHLAKAPAKFDQRQLVRWQKSCVLAASEDEFWQWIPNEVKTMVPASDKSAFVDAIQGNCTFPQDVLTWAHAIFDDTLEYQEEARKVIEAAGMDFFNETKIVLDQAGPDFLAIANALKEKTGLKGKSLFLPIRVVFSGQLNGPEMKKVLPLMGKVRLHARLNGVIELLQKANS